MNTNHHPTGPRFLLDSDGELFIEDQDGEIVIRIDIEQRRELGNLIEAAEFFEDRERAREARHG